MDDQPFPWGSILPLSLTVMVAFGIMLYGFSVFLTDGAAGGEFTTGLLSLAFGGGVVAAGLLAFPVGRWADRRGVRGIFGMGALLGALGLFGFSVAAEPWQVLAAWWFFMGPAGAMTYYEPAFIAVDRWCTVSQRPRALAVLTFIGGLAGIVFIPGVERLVAAVEWRPAARLLGVLLLVVGGGTWLFALRDEPSALHGSHEVARFSLGALFRDRRFVVYTTGMVLSFIGAQAILSHRVARFEEAGFAVAAVAVWAAIASALSLPGRSIAPFVARRFRPAYVQATAVAFMALAVVLMVDGSKVWLMNGHFALFGLAFGAVLPLRAMVMGKWYSGGNFGRTMGAQWTITSILGAAGPAVVGVLHDTTGSYQVPMTVIVATMAVAAGLILTSGRLAGREAADSLERVHYPEAPQREQGDGTYSQHH